MARTVRRGTRRAIVRQITPKRPIEKVLQNFASATTTGGAAVALFGGVTSFPGTWSGFRWNVNVLGTGADHIQWVICKVRDGLAPNNINQYTITPATVNTMQAPEVDVIAWGALSCTAAMPNMMQEGSTKSMRKMNKGDQIMFLYRSLAGASQITLNIQAFYKT